MFRHLLVKDCAPDQPYEVPVPFFLIVHPRGNVLLDTGEPKSAIAVRPDPANRYLPVMTAAEYVTVQLAEKLDLRPADITHVIVSHLHSDHGGGLGEFPDAVHYLRRAELQDGDNAARLAPLRLKLCELDDTADYDLFGDGLVRIIPTPGHTPGHQSLLLNLQHWGPTLLAVDSVYTEDVLRDGGLPAVAADWDVTRRTLDRIRAMRRSGIRVLTGHDPDAWSRFKLAPDYYD